MIKESSTVFCLGSPEGKRAFFRKGVSEENVYADNDEVFACITEDDKSYFIVCAPPCENLTAEEYFRSNRALISPADFDFSALRSFVFKTCGFILFRKTRMKSLSSFGYRAVQLFTLITEKTKQVAVNFDGTDYTAENALKMNRFLRCINKKYAVFALVTDNRFIPDGATVRRYGYDGEYTQLSLGGRGCVSIKKKNALACAAKRGVGIDASQIKKVVITRG